MPTILIQCPDSVLISLKETPKKFAYEATKLLAVKFYEIGKLPSILSSSIGTLETVVENVAFYGYSFNINSQGNMVV